MNSEMYYLLGALRDGNFDIREGKNYELRIYQKDVAWLNFISKIISTNFGIKPKISSNLLRVNNRKVVEEMVLISGYKCPQEFWDTPEVVKRASDVDKWWYLSGFFDAEGGVPYEQSPQKYTSFDQKSHDALNFLREFLITQDFIPTNLTLTGKVWQFRITRKQHIKNFACRVHSFHEKRNRLLNLAAFLP